nr:immunoglobulin heavy chain junction region [Macaca mulatta]MOX59697.1 immunoglobulin heavy chain junction region [Macaca mulatta]MOX61350.1 immunoglobulin heavy chain junction region [Macaca mulatta]MOX63747.1 immunoglobulin heavy chain junction region [Macaca mulatta]MOX67415.1 immunoglobulin heavy chain junction region [Macaca mulatta]
CARVVYYDSSYSTSPYNRFDVW